MTGADHAAVLDVMARYFDGLHHADSATLRQVFHPGLAYVCATEGDYLNLDLDAYMARVDQRVPPAERGDPREERIETIAFGGDRLAHVTARMSMMGRDYLDFLTLIREGGEWRIVAKVFSHVEREA